MVDVIINKRENSLGYIGSEVNSLTILSTLFSSPNPGEVSNWGRNFFPKPGHRQNGKWPLKHHKAPMVKLYKYYTLYILNSKILHHSSNCSSFSNIYDI